jgi:Stress responsive A/B Barrel Domain
MDNSRTRTSVAALLALIPAYFVARWLGSSLTSGQGKNSTNGNKANQLNHIVLLNVVDVELLERGLPLLRDIPGVVDVQFGKNVNQPYPSWQDRGQGYNYVLVVVLESVESLQAYDGHAIHQRVKADFIIPSLNKSAPTVPVLALDFLDGNAKSKL